MISALYFDEKFPSLSSEEAPLKWNDLLSKCLNQNVFSIYEWGKFKETSWSVERILFYNKETFIGMTQIQFKQLGPIRLGWCSSGINLTDYKYLQGIIDSLKVKYNFKKTIIRFNFLDPGHGDICFEFDSVKSLQRVPASINSGYTIRFYSRAPVKIPSDFSSNNRYYLKKAKERSFEFLVSDVNPKEYVAVHNQMVNHKGLDDLAVSEEQINSLVSVFNSKVKMIRVLEGEKCLASALVIMVNKIAYYYLAGATEEGREKNASFFMIEQLLLYFQELKIEEFDFGGITPFKESAKGVNRFKIGFGGEIINYVGERNLCHSKGLAWIFNIIISKKLGA